MIFLIVALAYLMVGIQYARVNYARQLAAVGGEPFKAISKYDYDARKKVSHSPNCYSGYGRSTYESCGCDCGAIDSYNRNGKRVIRPTNPFLVLVAYPGFMLNNYLKGGEVNTKPLVSPDTLAELERSVGIEPLPKE